MKGEGTNLSPSQEFIMTETKAVNIGPNEERHGEIVTMRPHPREANYVLYTRGGSKFEFPDRASHYRILSDVTNLAPEIDDTPAEEHMVYCDCGEDSILYGQTALVRPTGKPEFVDVLFDDPDLGAWAHCWRRLPRNAFRPLGFAGSGDDPDPSSVADTWPWVIDDPHIADETWPWALAGIGVSDMPPAPTPTKPARKVHRLGRLFDDVQQRTPVNHGPAPVSMMRVMDGEQWDAAVLVRSEGEEK
jgi:hypothetical protein